VQNYANDIGGAEAENILNAADAECEPAKAGGNDEAERIRITIVPNVGFVVPDRTRNQAV
jgi:hypothetical protein